MIENSDFIEATEQTNPPIVKFQMYTFQIVEYILIGLFSLYFFLRLIQVPTFIPEEFVLIFVLIILVFSLVKIYFEYKNKLITVLGIFFKIFLVTMNISAILIGILFEVLNWEYASEMLTTSLLSFSWVYLIFGLTLKDIPTKMKIMLAVNSFTVQLLAIGMLFKMQGWPNGQEMIWSGFIFSIVSLIGLVVLLFKSTSRKESYHAMNFIGRCILLMIWSLFYM